MPIAEVKGDFSRYLKEAAGGRQIVITRHGKPAGVLIGFKSEEACGKGRRTEGLARGGNGAGTRQRLRMLRPYSICCITGTSIRRERHDHGSVMMDKPLSFDAMVTRDAVDAGPA